jgi:hypothetical protein
MQLDDNILNLYDERLTNSGYKTRSECYQVAVKTKLLPEKSILAAIDVHLERSKPSLKFMKMCFEQLL